MSAFKTDNDNISRREHFDLVNGNIFSRQLFKSQNSVWNRSTEIRCQRFESMNGKITGYLYCKLINSSSNLTSAFRFGQRKVDASVLNLSTMFLDFVDSNPSTAKLPNLSISNWSIITFLCQLLELIYISISMNDSLIRHQHYRNNISRCQHFEEVNVNEIRS